MYFEKLHQKKILKRRIGVLGKQIVPLLSANSSILDVGCGSGELAKYISELKSDLKISGIDTLIRDDTDIPVVAYDGNTIPFDDNYFDVVMLVDVLHHVDHHKILLQEALRVTKKYILIKDHTQDGFLAKQRLSFMDRVGNCRFGVDVIYNYLSEKKWRKLFNELDLEVIHWKSQLNLYPFPASLLFDANLHYIALLQKQSTPRK